MDGQTLGTRIEHIRRNLGDTLEEFGNRLDPPASKGTVHTWENNLYKPNPQRLSIIASLGGVSVDKLLYGEGYTPERVEQMLENNPNELEQLFTEKFVYDLEDLSFLSDDARATLSNWLEEELTLENHKISGKKLMIYLANQVFGIIIGEIPPPRKIPEELSKDFGVDVVSDYLNNDTLAQLFNIRILIDVLGELEREDIDRQIEELETKQINSHKSAYSKLEKMLDEIEETLAALNELVTTIQNKTIVEQIKKNINRLTNLQEELKENLKRIEVELNQIDNF